MKFVLVSIYHLHPPEEIEIWYCRGSSELWWSNDENQSKRTSLGGISNVSKIKWMQLVQGEAQKGKKNQQTTLQASISKGQQECKQQ